MADIRLAPRHPAALLHISGGLASGGPVLTVAGELDVMAAPAVEACFEVFKVCHAPRLVVDAARLRFCDYAGLAPTLRFYPTAADAFADVE